MPASVAALGRPVAIKVLSGSTIDRAALRRFEEASCLLQMADRGNGSFSLLTRKIEPWAGGVVRSVR